MVRRIVLSVVLVALAVASMPISVARAFCGFYVAGADAELVNNATMVVMMREGTRTVLAMQNNYQGPPENFAMVVPVPIVLQEENVKTLPKEVFTHVDHLAAPRLVEYWEQDPCFQPPDYEMEPMAAPTAMAAEDRAAGSGGGLGVTIEAQFTVGEYEIVILSARDSTGLDTWLRTNGYAIPDGAADVLRPYVEGGMKFFVAKVDVTKVHFEDGQVMLSPLRFHYDSEQFSLPVRLGLLNSSGTQDLLVHILAPNQRYEVANYPNVTIPTNFDVSDDVRQRFGEFYAAVFDATLERNARSIVTEYAWQASNCDPCPGPVLDASDLMTLGADVLPTTAGGGRQGTVSASTNVTSGSLPSDVATMIVDRQSAAIQTCYQDALNRGSTYSGMLPIRLSVTSSGVTNGDPVISGGGSSDAAMNACIVRALSSVRFPPPENGQAATVEVRLSLASAPRNPWEQQMHLQGFVLTRLHARYSKEALNEDLVFRPADPIVGGREFVQTDGKLEEGSRPDSVNNFQARYAIRHPWEGPIACANPRRGVWGGPPAGVNADTSIRPATDLAFAPRGNVTLTQMIRQNVPELGLTATQTVGAALNAGASTATTATTTDVPPSEGSSGGCGLCSVGAGRDVPASLFAFVGLAGLFWLRRARRR